MLGQVTTRWGRERTLSCCFIFREGHALPVHSSFPQIQSGSRLAGLSRRQVVFTFSSSHQG